uniref:C3H1-type domain-containing protein n=1 Tax=Chromera velia CCMP2878 TaxID=1169474 RepID=A0A0G4FHL6_9ALVE|eukprot:Cvel_16999.t1-p1 / transcript=Cvel_16999.t1 / gene=Cvel_16999 / organism=Chromera_velia_CCMP2878 / gene_product=Uncharacterized exonuclease domain-containing, putative / transcript_product=Uncharacterized exonuclease domain-containing, putative / location=Cvel_scaffold1336:2063-5506(-) / protein_length=372 / sequence_SO=supercontig / SO=protein_coding / is_pseudo=false
MPCRFFSAQGSCRNGSDCNFAHVIGEQAPRPPICHVFATTGNCRFEERCHYRHEKAAEPSAAAGGRGRRPREFRGDGGDGTLTPGALCKYFAAGHCTFGARCHCTHDAAAIEAAEAKWLHERHVPEKPLDIPQSILPTPQAFDLVGIMDFEGKEEVIEFPLVLLRTADWKEEGRFHRWCRPTAWGQPGSHTQSSREHCNVRSTAVPFSEAFASVCDFLRDKGVDLDFTGRAGEQKKGKSLLLCICGNWDLKSQLPKQLNLSGVGACPPVFLQWMNIKDFCLNFYPEATAKKVKGMKPMLNFLGIPLEGEHHIGMDDVSNLCRILTRMGHDGASFVPTARFVNINETRGFSQPGGAVAFLLQDRVTPGTAGPR